MAVFPTSWAPSFILGFSCIVIVVISALGTGIYLLHVRHIQPRIQARKAARLRGFSASTAVDKEKNLEHGPLPYSNVPVNSSTVWPAPTPHQPDSGLQPPDPQLPWPVLAVLPSLRPKDPVHVRMKNAVMLRNKQEVRHEPFTVADVMRAMEEASAHTLMQGNTPPSLSNPALAGRPIATTPSSHMPEIVVHPADGRPSFSPALEEWSVAAMSEVSTATISSVSPTDSEPQTPHPASHHSHLGSPRVFFQSSPPIAPMESLRVPVHPPNTRDDDRMMAVNVSNLSGQKFVLSTPPVKRYPQAARGPTHAHVGLGFVHGTPSRAVTPANLSDSYEADSSLDISSSSLGVTFDASGSIPGPLSLANSQSVYSMPSKTSTTRATDGHSQSSQSTWNAGYAAHARPAYLRGANPFYDSRSGSGEGESVPDASPAVAADAEADAETNTISEENYFECSAEFEEEDITVQSVGFVYGV